MKKTRRSSSTAAAVNHEDGNQEPLLPGLPDHLARLCLSLVPAPLLYSVCRSWRRLIYSPSFPPFLSLYALLSNPHGEPDIVFYIYDPIAAVWRPLPAPPPRRLLLHHPSFIARALPVQSVAAAGKLVLLAATTHSLVPALPRPLIFNPASCTWRLGPKMPHPRRWCAAGAAGGCVYVASGVGREYSSEVARSAERWDVGRCGAEWEPVATMRDGRFSREAVGAVAALGKLYMVSMQGGPGPRDGAVYDVKSDQWEEMPKGMVAGWTGPAASEEDTIFTVEEKSGALRAYNWKSHCWETVGSSEKLERVVAVAAGGGRVCVACGGGATVVVVDVVARGRRMWTVAPPVGKRVIALHVLPRISLVECPSW